MSADKYQRLRDALAAGEFDFGQVCCGDVIWSGRPSEPPECCGQPLTAADDIRALLDERDRLRDALEKLARLGNGDYYGNSEGNMIARAALENNDAHP